MSYGIINVVKDLLTGKLTFVNKTTRQARKAICEPCEVRNTKTNTCTACGCWLPAKRTLADAACPMELW